MIRVFIVDDHELVRIGLRTVLESEPDIQVVGEAWVVPDAVREILLANPDVVLCDYHLPGGDGLSVVRQIIRAAPSIRVLVVSVIDTGSIPAQLLAAGALGYVTKASDGASLVRGVRAVSRGERYIDDVLTNRLTTLPSAFDSLSPLQRDVALLIVHGYSPGKISEVLGIKIGTVWTHRGRAFKKLGISHERELILLAQEHGFGTKS
ncbi:response regulator [Lysobacter antibioticus]|uniref:response regulator n=1 Tax=Lysobacter antibioticus TaxID=84531 RepID=UPI0004CFFA7D|nr:response regulator transcription factor [Lysobacter antibioticus]